MEEASPIFAALPCCFAFFAVVLGLAAMALWIWMIIDCATNEPSEGNDKVVWILVVVLLSWLGALIGDANRKGGQLSG